MQAQLARRPWTQRRLQATLHQRLTRSAFPDPAVFTWDTRFVAKGMEEPVLPYIRHEYRVYDRIRPLQGTRVPVWLGAVDLLLPYY